jgi:hypothetical protein
MISEISGAAAAGKAAPEKKATRKGSHGQGQKMRDLFMFGCDKWEGKQLWGRRGFDERAMHHDTDFLFRQSFLGIFLSADPPLSLPCGLYEGSNP